MKKFLACVGAGAIVTYNYHYYNPDLTRPSFDDSKVPPFKYQEQPTRQDCLARLQCASSPSTALDVLVVGGGATGCGVALDAVTRGLSVGLVEANDYASGTSSRSTKLIHGGVRYLEKAILGLDKEQYKLVAEALRERAIMIHQAPHLCHTLATLLPCYDPYDLMQFWAGMKAYDIIAAWNKGTLTFSRFQLPVHCLNGFPKLRHDLKNTGSVLLGGVVYYDGQMDDARMCLSAALTAASFGAATLNHARLEACKVVTPNSSDPEVAEATVRDKISGKTFVVFAKSIVNCGGPFSDGVRKLGGDQRPSCMVPSAGTHITLPQAYCPKESAMLIPSDDGRVVFSIPWLGSCIVGTTDNKTEVTESPRGTKSDVKFLLNSLEPYLGRIPMSQVTSVWCGIRPLARPLQAASNSASAGGATETTSSTQDIIREHSIDVDPTHRMVSVTGGKWTTYRKMAQDTVDALLASRLMGGAKCGPCVTEHLRLVGATSGKAPDEVQAALATSEVDALPEAVLHRWVSGFGDRATLVAREARTLSASKKKQKLAATVPLAAAQAITPAEIRYCALYEHCETVSDYLERRSRLAFLNATEAVNVVEAVADVMGDTLGWSSAVKKQRAQDALSSLQQYFATKE